MVQKSRTPAGPANTSRAAGAVAPTSAAATEPGLGAHVDGQEPRGGFYAPEGEQAESPAPPPSPSALAMVRFAESVREESPGDDEGLTADVETAAAASTEGELSEESLAEAIARIRGIRKPLGAFSQKLALPQRSGYHRHWFNDVAGRIEEAAANGWAHVTGSDGKPIKRCVGSGRDKGAMFAYAMELPEVFWQEDQDARHDAATQKIESLKAAPFRAQPGSAKADDKGKFYSPSESNEAGPLQVVKGR